ncbi:MAG: hypothetical protein Q9182_007076 [Xanthomendoza sp. 2 TL-2023]
MRSISTVSLLCLTIIYPLTVSAQRGGNRFGGNRGSRGPPVGQTTTFANVPQPTITPPSVTTTVQNGGNGDDQTTSTTSFRPATTTNAGTTGGGTTTSGQCGGAVPGNMNVKISGASVSYRLQPPVPGNPTTGTIGDCDTWSFPVGWNGRVHIGGGSGAPDGGTLFEGNNIDGTIGAMDVSFVEGFSVPMLCTDTTNNFVSGCGLDLFSLSSCPTGGSAGGVCKNPQGPGGTRDSKDRACEACSPPDAFFAPCSAAAYTFPTDDAAVDGRGGLEISCVVGAGGGTPSRAGSTSQTGNPQSGRCEVCPGSVKRSLEDVLFGRDVEPQPMARSPSMLPRVRRKSVGLDVLGKRAHRHGIAHGSDNVR